MALGATAAALILFSSLISIASSDTIPLTSPTVAGYRMPSIFAFNNGKPFYLDKNPETGAFDFNAGGKEATEPVAAESSSVASAATALDEDEREVDEKDEEEEGAAAEDSGPSKRPKPLQAAPVVEEVDEDDLPPPTHPPLAPALPKDHIDRKDTAASTKTSGGRPNDIKDGEEDDNPYFQQFINLNVHEYGDRIPGASSIRDEPYSFGSLGLGRSPLEREYKFPLISSSYANTKVQGAGGNYFYGTKDKEKGKEKEKYKPAYTGPYTPSPSRRPGPSYYHESAQDEDEDHYYAPRPSASSAAADDEEEEDDDRRKYPAESSYHKDREEANDEEDESEEEGESVDELVEEVSDPDRAPVHPKRPQSPSRQPPKKPSPTNHHYHAQEEEEDESEDGDEERPSYYGGTGGFGGRPAADSPRPSNQQQNNYYYGRPSDEEDEEEEDQEGPNQKKPSNFQGGHRGEEDRPRPSHTEEEEVDEDEGEEGGETNVDERPPQPTKPSLSYLGFEGNYDKESHGNFGEKVQGSQKVEKPDYNKYNYNRPSEFHVDGYYDSSSDKREPQKKPSRLPPIEDSTADVEGPKKEAEAEETESEINDDRRPYNPPQKIAQFSQLESTQVPTERPQRPISSSRPPPTSALPPREVYHKPTYPSPYGLEEPFRPIYGPEETNSGSFARPVQAYPQQPIRNQNYPSSTRPPTSTRSPYHSTPSVDTRPSGFQQQYNYYPHRPITVNDVPQKKKDTATPENVHREPISSTFKPQYDLKTKKPIDQGPTLWKDDASETSEVPILKPTQEVSKEASNEQNRPNQKNGQENPSKWPSTLPPPPYREVVGIGSVGEPEYIKPTQQPSYGPFRFPDQEYIPQRAPVQQPLFLPRPSSNNGVTVNPNQPPPPFGLAPQNGQRPVLPPPPSPILRPQLLDNPPPPYHRPQGASGAAPPPRPWEDRPIHPNNRHPPSHNFLHRPRPQEPQAVGSQQTAGHPYKFVSRKPGQEPVLMSSAPNAVFGSDKKIVPSPNGPKTQAPDPNLPNILPQFRPNAKISYSTIQREKGPYSPPPPPPPQFGPIQRVSNVPERPARPLPSFYENLQPPPPPNNLRLHRIQGAIDDIPYGPPQIYPFGPLGTPPVGRRSGQQHQARVGEDTEDAASEKRPPQVTTLQMMRNGLLDHQSARHPIISREDVAPKPSSIPSAEINVKPTIYVTPDDGSTSASLSVDSSASEDHPVFVVYPVSDSSHQEEGVVIGMRGSQKPLPPSSIADDNPEPSVLPTRPNSVNSDFPYPLLRPGSNVPSKPDATLVGPVYSFLQEEGPEDRLKEHSDSNIIPYIQDYSPYATKRPTAVREGPATTVATEISSSTTPSPPKTTQATEKMTTKAVQPIVEVWQPESEVEVSATMHAASPGIPTNHRPLVEDKIDVSSPSPLNFQAPFHASENIEPSPDSGWSAVGGSTSTVTSPIIPSISRSESNSQEKVVEGENTEKFNFDNFKPQLFGGFKPIYSLLGEDEDELKFSSLTTERQER